MSNQKTGPFDIILGKKLKNRRLELGLSQQQVASTIGVTFQQIQKYEKGLNRISSARLNELAQSLKTTLNYFFSPLSDSNSDNYNFPDEVITQLAEDQNDFNILNENDKIQLYELISCFSKIKDEKLRQNILNLAKSLKNY